MDSFARTGKSNRVLPAYQEVRLKAKRRAVSADLSLAKRAAASRITRHFGTTAIPATVSVPLSLMSYSPNVPPCWPCWCAQPTTLSVLAALSLRSHLADVWRGLRTCVGAEAPSDAKTTRMPNPHPDRCLHPPWESPQSISSDRFHPADSMACTGRAAGSCLAPRRADIGFRGSMDAGEAVVFRCDLS
jgi:hypothetical protein